MKFFTPSNLYTLVDYVVKTGVRVSSERGMTYEVENAVLFNSSPRDRVAIEKWRKMNIGFAIVDALSHIVGDNSLAPLVQFVPGFSAYSSDGKTIDGAYGTRIGGSGQLGRIIYMLKDNPTTRRAVLSIYDGKTDLFGGGGLNTPCTLNMHFLVRDNKLNMKVMMRSNDIILGLTNDFFTFTFLHEFVATQAGIPLGIYSHYASSLHVYESDLYKYRNMKRENVWGYQMKKMPPTFNPNKVYLAICDLHKTKITECISICNDYSDYERNLYLTCASIYFRKHEQVRMISSLISDKALHIVTDRWIQPEENNETNSLQHESDGERF